MSQEYLDAMSDDFKKGPSAFQRDLTSIRTGRATPQILEPVKVEVASYGAVMPLNQIATVSAPDPRLLVVNPWDKNTISDIEKGILAAGLGLNPSNDGQVVRVPIPPLTGERRKQMTRQVGKLAEDFRIRARQVRKEYNELFRELESEKEITEDDLKRFLDQVQKSTDVCVAEVNKLAAQKEKEVMEV